MREKVYGKKGICRETLLPDFIYRGFEKRKTLWVSGTNFFLGFYLTYTYLYI